MTEFLLFALIMALLVCTALTLHAMNRVEEAMNWVRWWAENQPQPSRYEVKTQPSVSADELRFILRRESTDLEDSPQVFPKWPGTSSE